MDPSKLSLTYTPGPKFLQILRGDVVFWVDGIQGLFPSRAASEVLACIAMHHPNTITKDALFKRLNRALNIGSIESQDGTVHKYVSQARKSFRDAGLKIDVIETIKPHGYRLCSGWEPERAHQSNDLLSDDISQISGLIERCILQIQNGHLTTNKGGLMYFEADQHILQENYILLDRFGWKLIHALSTAETVSDVMKIKDDIHQLFSYVLFWRIGDGLTEEKWKIDYAKEIHALFGDIRMRIRKIIEAGAGVSSA